MRLQSPKATQYASRESKRARSKKTGALKRSKSRSKGRLPEPIPVRAPPLALGDLECLRNLGTGAYASVFLVRVRPREEPHQEDRPGSLFALKVLSKSEIKVLRKSRPNEADVEVECLCKLPWNPWLSGVVDVFHDPLNLYLMLEYVPAGSLHDIIHRHGPLDATTARFYYANIVCALTFLHTNNIVHRDLKPHNILVKSDGYISLVDFGLAKSLDTADTWVLAGTPIYMAPELYFPDLGTSQAVDWWSSGIILYEMITRRVPFYGKSEVDVWARTASKKYKWPRGIRVGRALKSVVAGLLTHGPEDRLGFDQPVCEHTWLSSIDWGKMNGQRYIAPRIPGDVDLLRTWQDKRLPSQEEVPGLQVVVPPEYLRHDDRFPRRKKRDDQPAPQDERHPITVTKTQLVDSPASVSQGEDRSDHIPI